MSGNSRDRRRRTGVFALVAVLALLAGCESISDATDSVRSRLAARDEGKVRDFAAPPRVVYETLRQAATQMGYRYVRGGPAQGEFDAVSGVRAGETHGSARQIVMKVRLRPTLDGAGTEATVKLTEVIESDSSNRAGQAVEVPLRDTPQYQVLFERISQLLPASATPAEPRSNRDQKSR